MSSQWLYRCAVFFGCSPGGLHHISVPSGCIDVLFSLAVHQMGYTVCLSPVDVKMCCFLWLSAK